MAGKGCCIDILLTAGHEPKGCFLGDDHWPENRGFRSSVAALEIIELSSGHSRLAPLNLLASCSLSDLGDSGLEGR